MVPVLCTYISPSSNDGIGGNYRTYLLAPSPMTFKGWTSLGMGSWSRALDMTFAHRYLAKNQKADGLPCSRWA